MKTKLLEMRVVALKDKALIGFDHIDERFCVGERHVISSLICVKHEKQACLSNGSTEMKLNHVNWIYVDDLQRHLDNLTHWANHWKGFQPRAGDMKPGDKIEVVDKDGRSCKIRKLKYIFSNDSYPYLCESDAEHQMYCAWKFARPIAKTRTVEMKKEKHADGGMVYTWWEDVK